ncbi:hypothetical protein QMZ05_24530 [Bradyrhizobium sp. INPA03-11B]|uniref:helix-turn-helix domain-containing protein n=1 Tax=Bradyrhizobium sp. INPA03-11B TaxID=418598 RepID=UPI00338E407D
MQENENPERGRHRVGVLEFGRLLQQSSEYRTARPGAIIFSHCHQRWPFHRQGGVIVIDITASSSAVIIPHPALNGAGKATTTNIEVEKRSKASSPSRWTQKGIMEWLATKMAILKPGPFQVLFAMARYADKDSGSCFVSLDTLAADLDTSVGYVHRLANELAEGGHIRKRAGQQGRGYSNTYWLIGSPEEIEQFQRSEAAVRTARREQFETRAAPTTTMLDVGTPDPADDEIPF